VSTAEVAEVLGHYPGVVEAIVYGVEVPGKPQLFILPPSILHLTPPFLLLYPIYAADV